MPKGKGYGNQSSVDPGSAAFRSGKYGGGSYAMKGHGAESGVDPMAAPFGKPYPAGNKRAKHPMRSNPGGHKKGY